MHSHGNPYWTAELYGKGHSETVIGQALRAWRGQKIYVATKAQPIRWPDADDDHPAMRGRFPAWYLRDSVEQSLRRLGVERIDLFQLHSWMPDGLHALDWLETPAPKRWRFGSEEVTYDWGE